MWLYTQIWAQKGLKLVIFVHNVKIQINRNKDKETIADDIKL